MRTLAERIRWIQKHSGPKKLSLAVVATRGGLSRQGLSRIVRQSDKSPGDSVGRGGTLEKLASGNNVDHTWLVTGKGAPRKGKLSPLETVLSEREWSESARAGAMAEKRELTADGWRHLLTSLETLFAATGGAVEEKRKHRNRPK